MRCHCTFQAVVAFSCSNNARVCSLSLRERQYQSASPPPPSFFFSSFFPLSPFTLDYLGFQGNARCLAAIQTQCHLPAECAQRTASDHPARKMGAASVSTRAAFASSTTWKECAVSSVAPRTLKHTAGACGTVRQTTLSQINIYR